MNIFYLHSDPAICAQMHCDRHVVKMILETAQLLCTAHRYLGVDWGYKSTHVNHPCSVWTRETAGNYLWLKNLGLELCKEYTFRYDKVHKSQQVIQNCYYPSTWNYGKTPVPLCMSDDCKIIGDPVASYRKYYLMYKKHLLKYTKREIPEWVLKQSVIDQKLFDLIIETANKIHEATKDIKVMYIPIKEKINVV